MKVMLWSIDTKDWDTSNASARGIESTVNDNMHPEGISLMHDGGGDRQASVDLKGRNMSTTSQSDSQKKQTIELQVKKHNAEQWLTENKTAIKNYNKLVEKHGLFADKHRGF
jgi:post-segregation antitoxin (ccd killing protein)